ncbi:hypothetical protein GGR50DRAFT_453055 [Xylaria sp. CBS 124048]|nr:hypothetical protein GGR50DRAFT_453055 [Xylaria sp. CBS 124048]
MCSHHSSGTYSSTRKEKREKRTWNSGKLQSYEAAKLEGKAKIAGPTRQRKSLHTPFILRRLDSQWAPSPLEPIATPTPLRSTKSSERENPSRQPINLPNPSSKSLDIGPSRCEELIRYITFICGLRNNNIFHPGERAQRDVSLICQLICIAVSAQRARNPPPPKISTKTHAAPNHSIRNPFGHKQTTSTTSSSPSSPSADRPSCSP